MVWFGQSENEAQRAARERQKQEIAELEEARQKAEAVKDPYRAKVSWNLGRGYDVVHRPPAHK
jgi:hypothetical protein